MPGAPISTGFRAAGSRRAEEGRVGKGGGSRDWSSDVCSSDLEATAERNWVVVSDPIPAGATIVGDLGGQSRMLAEQGSDGPGIEFLATDGTGKLWDIQAGVRAAYVERGNDAWRAYFDWVPRGRFEVSYLVRLNGAGHFQLPPTHVEAMYSPEIHADLPNKPVTVRQR